MRSDSLVPLLAGQPQNDTGYRQGVVVAWNQSTAENLVTVGGALLTNLPALNTSEATLLVPGDVVVCVRWGRSWAVLGRVIIPGTSESASALSALRTESASVTAQDTITSTSYADAPVNVGPEITIQVGASGRLLVFPRAHILSQGPTTAAGNSLTVQGGMGFTLSGANTSAVTSDRVVTLEAGLMVTSSTHWIRIEGDAGGAILIEGLNPGATTLTAKYRSTSGVTTQVTNRTLTAMAI